MPKSVMLVDDSAPFRKLVMRTLQQGALSIGRFEDASDGEEALEKLDADPVDIVLCDINMPKMSGQDLVKKIRETDAYKGIKIIMVSSESS